MGVASRCSHCGASGEAGMTQYDDRECIRGAAYDEAELRKQCREGTERYLQALIAGGYLPAVRKAA